MHKHAQNVKHVFPLVAILLTIAVVGVSLAGGLSYALRPPVDEPQPSVTTETIKALIKQETSEAVRPLIEQLNSSDPFPNAKPENIRDYRHSLMIRRDMRPDRGGDFINRTDVYLARTPLHGQGRTFYLAAVDAGINPRLMPAIAMIESGGGRANANDNNFFGRKAVGGGWDSWSTKEEAIYNQARYIVSMWGQNASPYNMRGYCVPQFPWANKVATEMARV